MLRQVLISIFILILGLGLAKMLISSRAEPEEKPRENLSPLVQVAPLEIRSGNLIISGSGTIRASEELTLSSEVPGKLIFVSPDLREGQHIKAGTTLFRIDPVDYENAVETAKTDIQSRKVDVLQAEEEVAVAKAELALFEQRNERENSFDGDYSGSVILPPKSFDNLQNLGVETSTSTTLPNGLATREPQLQAARASLKRAEVQLSIAQNDLDSTVVKAPFSGVVRSENIALGSYVAPGQALGSIIGTNSYEAIIPLSEEEAALIPRLWEADKKPIEASIYVNYGGDKYRWPATVDRVNSILNPSTRTIDVFLKVKNPLKGGVANEQSEGALKKQGPPLFIGSFVDVEITGRALEEYAILPLTALRPNNRIWLVQDEELRSLNVDVFQRSDRTALISTAGLGLTPVVVLNPHKTATEGQKVRIAEAE